MIFAARESERRRCVVLGANSEDGMGGDKCVYRLAGTGAVTAAMGSVSCVGLVFVWSEVEELGGMILMGRGRGSWALPECGESGLPYCPPMAGVSGCSGGMFIRPSASAGRFV